MAPKPDRLVLRNGVVYSPSKPKATAVVIDRGEVVWLGGERALTKQIADDDQVIDVDGAIVAPSFCDAHRKAFGANDASTLMGREDGIGAAHMFPIIAGRGSTVDERMGRWLQVPSRPQAAAKPTHGIGLLAEHALTTIDAVKDHLAEAFEADVSAVFSITPTIDLKISIAGCKAWNEEYAEAPPVRFDGLARATPAELKALAKLDASIVFDGHRVDPSVAASAVRHGISIAFGSFGSQLDPWLWLRKVVAGASGGKKKGKSAGLSALDGFAAVTSGGWRVAGMKEKADLVVGSRVPLALWRIEGDSALLPDLTNVDQLPQWVASVVDGNYNPRTK